MTPQTDFSTLTGLVSHYSPSGQEHGVVEWLVERMTFLGYTQAWIDEAGNAVGVMGSGPKQVILLGHIDTVPGEIKVKQDTVHLYGRGSVDAKGALACFVDAVSKMDEVEGWQFIVIGAVEEERDSKGARYVAGRYKPDFTIIGEPNRWNRIALGYKGSATASVTIRRELTHSASAEKTAAEEAVELWIRIKAHVDVFNNNKSKVFDKILLSLNEIHSGSNDFEGWTSLKIGARLPVDVSPEDWYAVLHKIQSEYENNQPVIEPIGFAIPAWRCEKNTPIVRAFLKSIRSQGEEPSFTYKTGTADLNIVAPIWQCPMVVYGPGDSALDHTPNEHIAWEEYIKAVKVLISALSELVK
jgi:[amino group carrier protein]-lysine/ornithine hydrolase